MTNTSSSLRPATIDEVVDALSFALRYDGRRRVFHADNVMGQITAERLVRHLQQSGFVIMKAPPSSAPTISNMPPSPGKRDE